MLDERKIAHTFDTGSYSITRTTVLCVNPQAKLANYSSICACIVRNNQNKVWDTAKARTQTC